MILTCPSCSTRYLVAEGAIGPNGRRVRCANCGHLWEQAAEEGLDAELFGPEPDFLHDAQPEDDPFESPVDRSVDKLEDFSPSPAPDDFRSVLQKEIESIPIPEGVKPAQSDPVLDHVLSTKSKRTFKVSERAGGFLAAGVFYLLMFMVFLLGHQTISRAWPASNLIYSMIGISPVPPGEGLTLSNLNAEFQGDKIFMSGTIVNLKENDLTVPAVFIALRDDADKIIDHILLSPPVSSLKAEGSVDFETVYRKRPDNATNVTFAFSWMKPKESATQETSH